ncbi:mitochondrial [2Fe-2S] cluster assembly ferredoxin Etp1/ cytochrome oxidase cofactor Cox15 [Schizosaccharomyces osmophilus]|uniref:Mitochondrial [2Fe-2S] cluster assembly ferredoxin Etp1/ cytochrome oxidase cofactor Cox15 n=1 Tax=Schizosaccharomyces osmophilus TaxID=2545709 RepID=A0AAF0AX03_9SCHI|nr:mitochondrial [2Fe-2S] cluster assembly ferredoxin Etp1/ cytochrome oxidase cofactor Cox15 [Schizosaccharomyces osmophilus]WBW73414.1 mitochondrial [2Fe-2S] cluster assembly ferredoxin Etp1/ cytochrome oxidase cofactor Cox15 [Schizosaccharomyces osmophilus]
MNPLWFSRPPISRNALQLAGKGLSTRAFCRSSFLPQKSILARACLGKTLSNKLNVPFKLSSLKSFNYGTLNNSRLVATDAHFETNKKFIEADNIPSKKVAFWLLGSSALVLAIVIVGGITRLTESGLSITEWKPVSGVIPPLTSEQWNQEFELYKQSPEFQKLNSRMTVDEFKHIFFWEWFHRVLGRGIGLVIAVPSFYMLAKGKYSPWLKRRLLGLTGLVALQGVIGWWMVKSGLSKQMFEDGSHPRVSHYRLATHLAAAVALYIGLIWTGHGILQRHAFLKSFKNGTSSSINSMVSSVKSMKGLRLGASSLVGLTLTTLLSGALVAGLDAGMIYCTFPTMGEGRLAPAKEELLDVRYSRKEDHSDLYWRNMLDNPSLVQLQHRALAVTTFFTACGIFLYVRMKKRTLPKKISTSVSIATGALTAQAGLGILTLIHVVPVPLAVLHQAGSLVALTAALSLLQRLYPEFALRNVRSWVNPVPSMPSTTKPVTNALNQKRTFHSFSMLRHSATQKPAPGTGIKVYFVTPEGREVLIEGNEGDSILDLAHGNNIDLEGACEGSVACSTCHVVVDPEHYELLEAPEEDEEDMLDLAFGLEETSRLGCQVILRKDLDGIRVRIPSQTRNIRLERTK